MSTTPKVPLVADTVTEFIENEEAGYDQVPPIGQPFVPASVGQTIQLDISESGSITVPSITQTVIEPTRAEYLEQMAKFAISYGFVPIPLRDKIPVLKAWPDLVNNPRDPLKNARQVRHLVEAKGANNIGIVTGSASGVYVFDIELEGIPFWNSLVTANTTDYATIPSTTVSVMSNEPASRLAAGVILSPVPETFTVKTGTGGYHFYFRYNPSYGQNLRNNNKVAKQPLDFRTDRGMIVFPGSISSKTGNMYEVMAGYRSTGGYEAGPVLAEMPTWLYNLLLYNQQGYFKK